MRGAGSRLARWGREETKMQEPREAPSEDLPSEDEAIEREGEKNRSEIDAIPEHGTDPLHEGP
jgi:hypothetical protein